MTELLSQIKKKDKTAATVLYNRFGRKLFGYAVTKWQVTEDEAWELVYATLFKVIEVIDKYTFESELKFNGFVFTIFTNNLRNLYQKNKKLAVEVTSLNNHVELANSEGTSSSEEKPPENENMKHLQNELQLLEDWKRILLLMRAQGFSYEEIAKYVDKPPEQLKVYHMRIKKELTEKLNSRINTNNVKQ